MPTYAIGDVQGCYQQLMQLLELINFDPAEDTLWFTGDLVNRGPQSLKVLRFVNGLGDKHKTVLGNHDLHLLAIASGATRRNESDTLNYVLNANDTDKLLNWLRMQPLMLHDEQTGYVLVHAGLAPSWTVSKAKQLAAEVETVIQGKDQKEFFEQMYGNEPALWTEGLTGYDRLRCIVNYFTRMRYCYEDGRLDLKYKGPPEGRSPELVPWFDVMPRANGEAKIIFGHWASLDGKADTINVFALDTGCVWGNKLTAMCLETRERFSVPCAGSGAL